MSKSKFRAWIESDADRKITMQCHITRDIAWAAWRAAEQSMREGAKEPAGYFYEDGPGNWYQIMPGDSVPESARFPLYAAPQPVAVPLDYAQGEQDGREWAAQMAEANHPHTGDWLYDDPLELAKAIRKGPDLPIQPSSGALQLPDGWKLVPVEPTHDMLNAWLSEVANWRGHVAGYKAMLSAAPVNPEFTTQWIPCSERMPDDDDFVYIWPRPDFGTELHVGQYCKFHKKGAGWYAQVNEQNYGIEWYPITVTHWVPLPEPPRQED